MKENGRQERQQCRNANAMQAVQAAGGSRHGQAWAGRQQNGRQGIQAEPQQWSKPENYARARQKVVFTLVLWESCHHTNELSNHCPVSPL